MPITGGTHVWLVLPDSKLVCVARHALQDWLDAYPAARFAPGCRCRYPEDFSG